MLNLHKTADEGLYSTQKTSTNIEYMTQPDGTNRVELNTYWSSSHTSSTPDPGMEANIMSFGSTRITESTDHEGHHHGGVRWGAERRERSKRNRQGSEDGGLS